MIETIKTNAAETSSKTKSLLYQNCGGDLSEYPAPMIIIGSGYDNRNSNISNCLLVRPPLKIHAL